MKHVFFSHSSKDKQLADEEKDYSLVDRLIKPFRAKDWMFEDIDSDEDELDEEACILPYKPIEKHLFSNTALNYKKISVTRNQVLLCLLVVLLGVFGIVMTYGTKVSSSNAIFASIFTKRYVIYWVLGLIAFFITGNISLECWDKLTFKIGIFAGVTVFLLCTPLAIEVNATTRFLRFGSITIRPDEIVYFALILYIAHIVGNNYKKRGKYQMIMLVWVVTFIAAFIVNEITSQPVLVFYMMLIAYFVTLIFSDTVKFHKWVAVTSIGGTLIMCCLALSNVWQSFRAIRIHAWLNPYYDENICFQFREKIEALERGGLFGKGYGNSEFAHNYNYALADNFFSVVIEQIGWLGGMLFIALLLAFLYQIYRIMRIALEMEMYYPAALTATVLAHYGVRSICYIMSNLNLLPICSGCIPFVTYNGLTGTILFFAELGLVMAVGQACKRNGKILKEYSEIVEDTQIDENAEELKSMS